MDLGPIGIVIVAIIALAVVWRIITGVIRFVLTLGIIAIAAYLLWTFLA